MEVVLDGVPILIDEEDLPLVRSRKWRLSKGDAKKGYYYFRHSVWINGKSQLHLLHREIAGAPIGSKLVADHINGDTKDNRRCNLRIITRGENAVNARKISGEHASTYKGVTYDKALRKFRAVLHKGGVHTMVASSKDEVYVAEAYDIYSRYLYGDLARLNFPDKVYDPSRLEKMLQEIEASVARNNTSGYAGIYYHKRNNRWIAGVKDKGTKIYLGSFISKEKAYEARQQYLLEHPNIKTKR